MCTTININNAVALESQIDEAMAKPDEATHTIRFDILNVDGSVKRIEVSFCKTDTWSEAWPGMLNTADLIMAAFNKEVLDRDQFAVGSKVTIINRATGNPLKDLFIHPRIIKPSFIIRSAQ